MSAGRGAARAAIWSARAAKCLELQYRWPGQARLCGDRPALVHAQRADAAGGCEHGVLDLDSGGRRVPGKRLPGGDLVVGVRCDAGVPSRISGRTTLVFLFGQKFLLKGVATTGIK
jgi:hypothetical protein